MSSVSAVRKGKFEVNLRKTPGGSVLDRSAQFGNRVNSAGKWRQNGDVVEAGVERGRVGSKSNISKVGVKSGSDAAKVELKSIPKGATVELKSKPEAAKLDLKSSSGPAKVVVESNPNVAKVELKSGSDSPKIGVKSGSDGRSIIEISDGHVGVSIETNLSNANIILERNGEKQIIPDSTVISDSTVIPDTMIISDTIVISDPTAILDGKNKGICTIETLDCNDTTKKHSITYTKSEPDEVDTVNTKELSDKDCSVAIATKTTKTTSSKVIEQNVTNVKDERDGNVHAEKKHATIIDNKSPGNSRQGSSTTDKKSPINSTGANNGRGITPALKKVETKTPTPQQGIGAKKGGTFVDPKAGAKRETAAQRRARANKGVSAKNNPFKQQETASQGGKPVKANFKTAGGGGKADAGSSNIEKLLKWIQKRVNQYPAVDVTNFTTSWEDGIALCALMNYLLGDDVVDPKEVTEADKLERFEIALNAATEAGVPNYLDAEDLAKGQIDRKSMITYLHAVYAKLFVEKKDAEKKGEEQQG